MIDESVDVTLFDRDCVDGFDERACVDDDLEVRLFFDGDAESSLELSSLRTDFGLGEIFSVLSVAFDAAADTFADGRPAFGRCSFNGLTAGFLKAFADDDEIVNSKSPLFDLPSAFRPSKKYLRHFS